MQHRFFVQRAIKLIVSMGWPLVSSPFSAINFQLITTQAAEVDQFKLEIKPNYRC